METKKLSQLENSANDPAFLVAKGRFFVPAEKDRDTLFELRDNLLRDGQPGDSLEVVELTRQIEVLNQEIEVAQHDAEKHHVKSLATAIFMALSNHGNAVIRAVGRNATYNAVKAITIASGYCKPKGIDMCFEVSFDEGNIGVLRNKGHVKSVTAMLFRLKGYHDWVSSREKTQESIGD